MLRLRNHLADAIAGSVVGRRCRLTGSGGTAGRHSHGQTTLCIILVGRCFDGHRDTAQAKYEYRTAQLETGHFFHQILLE